MNWIQQYILLELTRHSTRRYSELRPDGVEGNLFLYHLGGLVKSGLVAKDDSLYQLTAKGRQEVANLSLDTGKTRRQPLVLTAVIARNEAGEVLLYRWQREPNTGLISPPHGMVHWGESLAAAAARELAEKAGLTGNLSPLGVANIRARHDSVVDRHMLVHVFGATGLEPIADAPATDCIWQQASSVAPEQWVPGFNELTRHLEAGSSDNSWSIDIEAAY